TRSKRDWSSDVCSSDLAIRLIADYAVPCLRAMMTAPPVPHFRAAGALAFVHSHVSSEPRFPDGLALLTALRKPVPERISFHRIKIGRASCRERVYISVV